MDQALSILSKIGIFVWRALIVYAATIPIFAVASVVQERKIWAPPSLPSLSPYGHVKVYLFNTMWMFCCLACSILLFPIYILSGGNIQYFSFMWCERTIAKGCMRAFVGNVKVVGAENLPPLDCGSPAPVYIANHASQLDLAVVYFLQGRRWKWISKKSVLYLPGVGQLMFLGQHVFIDRKKGSNKGSVANLFAKSDAAVQSGIPMFFFPQGTRRMSERLAFKDGAFKVAMNNKSALVPISIDIPLTAWNRAYPLPWGSREPVIVTVHKPIELDGTEDKEALKKQCADTIYSVLPDWTVATRPDEKKQD